MSASLDRIMALARAQLGIVERPVNRVKYNVAYYGRDVSGDAYPWCQAMTWWLAVTAGLAGIMPPKTAWTVSAANWFKAHGRWGTRPMPGAMVFYDWGKGIAHTGICESALLRGGYWQSIEGNTSRHGSQDNGGMVLRQARNRLGPTGGFGYPDYAGADAHAGHLIQAAPVALAAGLARRPDALPVLAIGASGGWVSLLQQGLGAGADGQFGPGTRAEVLDQQLQYGLVRDGVAGAWTWVSLIADAGANLAQGQAQGHPGVEVLQNQLGYRGADLDREFGPATTERVRQLQRWAGLEADGVVGPATRAALTRG